MRTGARQEGSPTSARANISAVTGEVTRCDIIAPGRKNPRLKMVSVTLTDGTGTVTAKWFNQTYLKKTFQPGRRIMISGVVKKDFRGAGFEMMKPEFECIDDDDGDAEQIHTGRIVPLYRLTEGLSQRRLRSVIHGALRDFVPSVEDPLPPEIVLSNSLGDMAESILGVHFPPEGSSLEELNRGVSPWHRRLAFDELFILQAGLAALKRGTVLESGIAFAPAGRLTEKLLSALPFRLTKAQERVFNDILHDMQSPHPMNRLIQGDVGSGKTIVALMAMLVAVECGYQAALMAPTEILAEQHYITMHRLVEDLGLTVHLLTGSTKQKDLSSISAGAADIIIGTHALIQEGVTFRNLGCIVIDEQHRFGVLQRASLRKKGLRPDTLIMTATPIPRTLALTLYGDLDYSVIDELPPGRKPVHTRTAGENQKDAVYAAIAENIGKGGQVYVVYPVIEESEESGLKAAITGMEGLRAKFPQARVGLIHGRMKPQEREAVMKEFKEGTVQILVATTVIEVGVDVPNATIMVIVHAERFGLAQLHQLRGRVGRGDNQSQCILLRYGATADALRRLRAMVGTTDGFRIAEEDLAIRGPGEFFGTRQSGLPDLKVADLVRDARLLEGARREAFALIDEDPGLRTHLPLRRAVEDAWGSKMDLFKTA